MNHRLLPRAHRRLRITIGRLHTFTSDVSARGFAAELMQVLRPGTDLCGSIELAGQEFPFTGKVCWARAGEPRINLRGRFGVRFTGIADTFFKLLESAYRPLPSMPA